MSKIMRHLFGYLVFASYICVIKRTDMQAQIIPVTAQNLLSQQSAIEIELERLEKIMNKAERSGCGLVVDSAKTPEYNEAKRLYSIYWNSYRDVNLKLSKLRKCIGYESVDGKRVSIYKYN